MKITFQNCQNRKMTYRKQQNLIVHLNSQCYNVLKNKNFIKKKIKLINRTSNRLN